MNSEAEYTKTPELLDRFPELSLWKLEDSLTDAESVEAAINVGIEAAIEEGDPSFIQSVLAALIRRCDISQVSKETGFSEQALRSVDRQPDLRLSAFAAVLRKLGYGLSVHKLSEQQRGLEHA